MKTNSKIGIVSGLGPLAGADVVSKIFKYAAEHHGAVEDHEYPNLVLVSQGVQGFDSRGVIRPNFEPDILDIAKQLKKLDVSLIGIACNTAHLFYESLAGVSGALVINLVDQVVAAIDAQGASRPLLLSSSTTRNTKLYSAKLDARQITYLQPNAKTQKLVDQAIYLVMAHKLAEAGQIIDAIARQAEPGAFGLIVAACTELPIAIAHSKVKMAYKVIDSNQILAETLTDHYYQSLRSET